MASRLVHVSLALGTTLLILCLSMTMVGALKDTVKNRMKLADQYIFENPVEENMEGMARYVPECFCSHSNRLFQLKAYFMEGKALCCTLILALSH